LWCKSWNENNFFWNYISHALDKIILNFNHEFCIILKKTYEPDNWHKNSYTQNSSGFILQAAKVTGILNKNKLILYFVIDEMETQLFFLQ
jgi:hypothetical protein